MNSCIREELKRRKGAEADLKERAKSIPEKLDMAARLRQETLLTRAAIAKRPRLEISA